MRPEVVGRTTDLRYYRYHRVVSHCLEKCIMLKEYIMQLAKHARIALDSDDNIDKSHFLAINCFS